MKEIGDGYTINYILITGTSSLHDSGAEVSTTGHQPESIHFSTEEEVVQWFRVFREEGNVRLISVVKHTDEMFEPNDIDRIWTAVKELAARGNVR